MEKLLKLAALAAAAIAPFAACAEDAIGSDKVGDVTTVGDTSFLLVCALNSPDDNVNFQRNLNIMQRDSRAAEMLKSQIASEKDAVKKTELENKLKSLESNFAVNDASMQKAYGFAASRSYKMVFLETNICVPLSSEELSTLKTAEGTPIDALKVFQRGTRSIYPIKIVTGVRENEKLQRMIGFVLSRRNDMEKLRSELASTTDVNRQMEITSQLSRAEKALSEAEDGLRKEYGIKPKTDYVIETSRSKLYLILSPEDVAKIKAEKAAKK